MSHSSSRGRPFGGQCWIFDNYLKVTENEFLNRHLSYAIFKYNTFEFAIIGTYMPFDDSSNRDNSKSMYELTLSLITVLINKLNTSNIPFFIVGDMNADVLRSNRFDKMLNEFTSEHELIFLDHIFTKKIPYTFNSNISSSKIDHALIQNKSSKNFSYLQCNLSDHRNLSIEFTFDSDSHKPEMIPSPPREQINFEDPQIATFLLNPLVKKLTQFSTHSQTQTLCLLINKFLSIITITPYAKHSKTHPKKLYLIKINATPK